MVTLYRACVRLINKTKPASAGACLFSFKTLHRNGIGMRSSCRLSLWKLNVFLYLHLRTSIHQTNCVHLLHTFGVPMALLIPTYRNVVGFPFDASSTVRIQVFHDIQRSGGADAAHEGRRCRIQQNTVLTEYFHHFLAVILHFPSAYFYIWASILAWSQTAKIAVVSLRATYQLCKITSFWEIHNMDLPSARKRSFTCLAFYY